MKLEAINISKLFGENGLRPVSLALAEDRFICVTGESGCGKTTLLNVLSGMLKPDTGDVLLDGKKIYSGLNESGRTALRNGKIGYMAQGNALVPELTVWQNIICPVEISGKKYDRAAAEELTAKLGIEKVKNSYPSGISGGEYRRALLARVILSDPELLLVDEPTSNLDEKSAHIVREILYGEYKKGKGLLVVTHDAEILKYGPEIISISSGGEN
ncbi:MAG: ATP-binding cassette domain-containing protein [Oscillospiraceae bacterium]|nr:ATP-binding cassette domain-containing protein [Oscillospiraceae bacterium]